MSDKKAPFIIDNDLSPRLKKYLPRDAKTTTECGLRPHAPDNPDVLDLCQRKNAILVTADTGFMKHVRDYQRAHNECCWGVLLLPDGEVNQIEVLSRLRSGKITFTYPKLKTFTFELARHDNLFINLRGNPPVIRELCDCEWNED
jgi:predicted nuclease of predicted toxin-antitoxin system